MTQPWIEGRFDPNVITTSLEQAINWSRQGSLWPMTFGIACCAIEMMGAGAGRYDLDRFGAGAFRASPRQSDLMIVAGTVNYKMASRVRRLWELMPDPKYVIAMGGCTIGGGPYFEFGYNIVPGRGPGCAGRRVRARLPAAAGIAPGRADAAAGQDHGPEDHPPAEAAQAGRRTGGTPAPKYPGATPPPPASGTPARRRVLGPLVRARA